MPAAVPEPAASPVIAVTPGEPAGIGPDLLVELSQQDITRRLCVLADPDILQERARALGTSLRILHATDRCAGTRARPGELLVLPCPFPNAVRPGHPDPGNAPALLESLRRACTLCLHGHAAAMVTGPVQKQTVNEAGIPFTGHTEYLASVCQAEHPVMLLACPQLRVALITTHLPLREVSMRITAEHLERSLRVIWQDSQRLFRLPSPNILVCGLNPHAGEQGHLGDEEARVIQPVLRKLAGEGMRMDGPVSADTAFSATNRERYDVFVCMYHDQGLPVLKTLGFGEAVNITLGLPIIRTSVDHGTALSLAGAGKADSGSLQAAISMARDIADHLPAVRQAAARQAD